MTCRIEDYALLGDCRTAALVSRDGSIDWLCWPRFDSDACFAALLGTPANGRWLLAPEGGAAAVARQYRDRTLILETTLETATGRCRLVECMAMQAEDSSIVRIVVGESGSVAFAMELALRFDYGACEPWHTALDDGAIEAVSGPDMVVLRTPVKLERREAKVLARFEVRAGERIPFVLSYRASHLPTPPALDADKAVERTQACWDEWCTAGDIGGEYAGEIERSLVTLKALTYAPTGGIVAAHTTSLPERIGGERNWDYHFCWLRDATLSLLALMR